MRSPSGEEYDFDVANERKKSTLSWYPCKIFWNSLFEVIKELKVQLSTK